MAVSHTRAAGRGDKCSSAGSAAEQLMRSEGKGGGEVVRVGGHMMTFVNWIVVMREIMRVSNIGGQ